MPSPPRQRKPRVASLICDLGWKSTEQFIPDRQLRLAPGSRWSRLPQGTPDILVNPLLPTFPVMEGGWRRVPRHGAPPQSIFAGSPQRGGLAPAPSSLEWTMMTVFGPG